MMTMCVSSNTTNEQSSHDSLGKITWLRPRVNSQISISGWQELQFAKFSILGLTFNVKVSLKNLISGILL